MFSAFQLPDSITLRLVLEACSVTGNLHFALQVHCYMLKLQGLYPLDVITNTCLLSLYREFGFIENALKVFERISDKDIVASTAIMAAFNEVGQYEETMRCFVDMLREDYLLPNEFAFTCGLRACAGLCSLFGGEQIHAYAVKASVQSNVFVGTCLVDMYAKCDAMSSAKLAFSEISSPNSFSWNALMGGNLSAGEVLDLFSQMRLSGVSPDHVTFATIIRACENVQLSLVRQLHALVVKVLNIQSDMFIGTALFDRYVDHGCICDAKQVFDEIHNKDLAAFNSAIQGYVRNGHADKAINLFYEALQQGKEVTDLTLTSLLMGVKDIHQGKQLHALVIKFGCAGNEVITSLLVTIFCNFDCAGDAVTLFHQVDNPDLILCTSLLSSLCPLEEAKQIHSLIVKLNAGTGTDLFVACGLIDTYAKCGCIADAKRLFDKMEHRDLASWNAIITGLAQHGYAKDAIETFDKMVNEPDIEPDNITFIGVLSACSHAGLVEEGYQYFQMVKEPTIAHYACLVNLVGRAGKLDEALRLIYKMPFEPTEPIWTSILAASGMHGNIEVAEQSAEQLLSLNPKDPGTYIALSNIYASNGRWKDVKRIRKLMKDRGVNKTPETGLDEQQLFIR
ncbi:hypothetical protein H6P81_002537 [Aristolochia fimbriata]|uniref:Pentatricopeptide repeat-containing protein n=1 Tax=Aristolochia fimbriata TaxID=158543 RepID=A0AAV7FBQ7_ARIFI|nr:hypothetical protein H6P81_002537 [Aristolochia fimbriata]